MRNTKLQIITSDSQELAISSSLGAQRTKGTPKTWRLNIGTFAFTTSFFEKLMKAMR